MKQILIVTTDTHEPDWYQTPDATLHVRYMAYKKGLRSTILRTRHWDLIVVDSAVVPALEENGELEDYMKWFDRYSEHAYVVV